MNLESEGGKMVFMDERTELHRADTVSNSKPQIGRLVYWCQDFGSFFGWKVRIVDQNSTIVVKVVANKSRYTISAKDYHLACIHHAGESGKPYHLDSGEFGFETFARIMIHILQLEASVDQKK